MQLSLILQPLNACISMALFSVSKLTVRRWFALVRIWSPWLAPRQGKTKFGLDKEAVLCSFLSLNGKHLVLLAVSGVNDVMTLFTSDSEGNVVLHVRRFYLRMDGAVTGVNLHRFEMIVRRIKLQLF